MSDEQSHGAPVYFPEGTVPRLADLCEVCRGEGLPQVAEALGEHALPCYSLEAADPSVKSQKRKPAGIMPRHSSSQASSHSESNSYYLQ